MEQSQHEPAIFREFNSRENLGKDRSAGDRRRHKELVKQGIKDQLPDIIAREDIIGKSGDTIIKIPIRSVKEYKFVYGENPEVSTGDGNAQPGQVVGKSQQGQQSGGGNQGQGGDQKGEDIVEVESTLEELTDYLFEDLKLPNLRKTALRQLIENRVAKKDGYRHVGIPVRLDKRMSAIQRIKRKKATERYTDATMVCVYCEGSGCEVCQGMDTHERRMPFSKNDLRYRHMEINPKPQSNAAIIFVMDVSGSVDDTKKFLIKSFMYLFYLFIRDKYDKSELVFIAFHTEANEVEQKIFFMKGTSGGTCVSSGLNKAIEVITNRYNPGLWNSYVILASDGDNADFDNAKMMTSMTTLKELCSMVGYIEVKPYGSRYYESSLLEKFRPLLDKNFKTGLIERKEDVYPRLKDLLKIAD